MTIVDTNFFQDDDVPTATQLNQPFNDLATASANIAADNSAPNWITRKHMFDGVVTPCNQLYSQIDNAGTHFTTTSTSYVTINNSALTEVTLNYSPNQNEILRVNASGLVTEIDVNVNYDNALAAGSKGKPNYYAFQILLEYNDGGGTLTETLGEWGYSFTNLSAGRYFTGTSDTDIRSGTPIGYQTFQFSTLTKYTGVTGTRTYEKLKLQCKVFDANNTLAISRNALYAIRPKA
jgi:hypothetical protein